MVTAWDSVSSVHDFLEAILSSYHNQVSEFVEELLITRSYFVGHTNYWVDSGLVSDSQTEVSVFQAAKAACSLKKGLFLQDAASTLFYSHLAFVRAFRQGILSSSFDSDLSNPLTFKECHWQVVDEGLSDAESAKRKGKGRA